MRSWAEIRASWAALIGSPRCRWTSIQALDGPRLSFGTGRDSGLSPSRQPGEASSRPRSAAR
jgi:hypothetical protein